MNKNTKLCKALNCLQLLSAGLHFYICNVRIVTWIMEFKKKKSVAVVPRIFMGYSGVVKRGTVDALLRKM